MIESAKVLDNEQLLPDFYELRLLAPEIGKQIQPGQFLMLTVGQSTDPYLKRPMGVHGIDAKRGLISIVYQLRGQGTRLLSQLHHGDYLELLGPLGRGWRIDQGLQHVLLVGGGSGIAPLLPLAEVYHQAGVAIDILLGAQNKEHIFAIEEFAEFGYLGLATDDGSLGQKGLISDILPAAPTYDQIYACGPLPMLRQVVDWGFRQGLPCQVSLEERMGCGIGTCMGCVCRTSNALEERLYQRVCKEGPVFDSTEVVL